MPSFTLRYNLHNFISIIIHTDSVKFWKHFEYEYGRFAMPYSAPCDAPSVIVQIVKKMPEQKPEDIYKTLKFKKIIPCSYLIRNVNSNKVEVYFKQSIFQNIYLRPCVTFLRSHIIHPLIYMILLKRDMLFMGSGVASLASGFIIVGKQGSGKTTLGLELIKRGLKFISEDRQFIGCGQDKSVYGGQHPFLLSLYNFKKMNRKLDLYRKVSLEFQNLLRFILQIITKERSLPRTWLPAEIICPGVEFSPPVHYKGVLIVENSESTQKRSDSIEHEKTVLDIIECNLRSENLYSYILFNNPDLKLETRAREVEVVRKMLSDISFVKYINPRNMDSEELDRLAEELQGMQLNRER